ncbi:MAG: ATP-binding cassette domain-containing protein [Bacteroidota bacterium]
MNNFLEISGVTKRYAAQTALNKVSISVPEKSIYGLLGPNGAGKTTLIRIINQITGPDEGEIFLNNERLQPHHIHTIGYLPEERGLYKKMKVGEQAIYLVRLKGLSKHDALKKLKYWFEKFEIEAWWNRKVEELSKGMQQKVQFIITILHEPSLLIFDEPFSGFDPINVNIIKEEILNLRNQGATILFSTHSMASVEELCDNIALIDKSNKILEGKVTEIKNTYKTNTYELEYEHDGSSVASILSSGMEVISQGKSGNFEKIRVKLNNGHSPNDLLKVVIPHASIHSLKEIIPTMNDIFIQKVTENEANSAF